MLPTTTILIVVRTPSVLHLDVIAGYLMLIVMTSSTTLPTVLGTSAPGVLNVASATSVSAAAHGV